MKNKICATTAGNSLNSIEKSKYLYLILLRIQSISK